MRDRPYGERTLHFRGTPGSLSALAPPEQELPRRLGVQVFLDRAERWTGAGELTARATRLEGEMTWQLALPARTPPGTYEATAVVDGEEVPIVIDVEPEVELQASPDQLVLNAAPGERVERQLIIANAGNVPAELRKAYAFGIFASGGLERSLHRVYTEERPEGVRRIDMLADLLAEEHGGIVRVAVTEGAGDLEPGEARAVDLSFHLPADLRSGRTYTGVLAVHDLRYHVRIEVTGRNDTPPRKAR
jgi:hypothetical protein